MEVMRTEGKYRILFDGEHLPEEIDQEELNSLLSALKNATRQLLDIMIDDSVRYGTTGRVIQKLFTDSCIDYGEFGNWKLNDLLDNITRLEEHLQNSDDIVQSYEDSETIVDRGYSEEWRDSGIYQKTMENSEQREIVEELFLQNGEFVYRKRRIEWEIDRGSKHSKDITYEILPIDNNLIRVLKNSRSFMKDLE